MTINKIKTLGFFALLYGLYLWFVLMNNLFDRTEEYWRFFYQFTQQSNIIVATYLSLLGFSIWFEKDKLYQTLSKKSVLIAVTVYISITFFVVLFILNPFFTGSWNPLSDTYEFFLHQLSPIVMWIFMYYFKGTGTLSDKQVLYIVIYPLIYIVLNLVMGFTTNYLDGEPAFAYQFINPNTYGNLFVYLMVLLLLFLVFGGFALGLIRFKRHLDAQTSDPVVR